MHSTSRRKVNSVKEQVRALERQLHLMKERDRDDELRRRGAIQQMEFEIKLLRALLKKDGYAIVGNEVQELRE